MCQTAPKLQGQHDLLEHLPEIQRDLTGLSISVPMGLLLLLLAFSNAALVVLAGGLR